MYDVLSSRKKKFKRFPSLKFHRSKSEICRPPLLEIGSSWARYFRSGNSTCDVIYITRDWWSLDFRAISVDFWLKYLRNVCRFRQKLNLGKICLKAVVKVAPSRQRRASTRQVTISNHTMIVPSQRRSYPCIEEEEPEDMLLSRFAEETDLLDWYFIWFLCLDSFCFYQCVYSLNYGLFL